MSGFSDPHDIPVLGSLHLRRRALHVERAMATPAAAMLEVAAENSSRAGLVEHDDEVQALSADAAERPIREWFLLGAPR